MLAPYRAGIFALSRKAAKTAVDHGMVHHLVSTPWTATNPGRSIRGACGQHKEMVHDGSRCFRRFLDQYHPTQSVVQSVTLALNITLNQTFPQGLASWKPLEQNGPRALLDTTLKESWVDLCLIIFLDRYVEPEMSGKNKPSTRHVWQKKSNNPTWTYTRAYSWHKQW